MAESKRIFNAGKINRDLDDRLVQPGEYRDALNINMGRSEGSDVGAVENLKGNERITGQDNIEGTTIGYTRDQANNRIYWFTKGTTVDAIHEYDMNTGMVNPILIDQVSNPLTKPTCTPDFTTPINRPTSDTPVRPELPRLPNPPQPVCNIEFGPNGRTNTNYVATLGQGQYADPNVCEEMEAPVVGATNPTPVISGTTIGTTNGDAITLSAAGSNPGTATGGAAATISSYAWSDDQGGSGTDSTYSVSARTTDGDTVVTLDITNSEGVSSDSVSPPTTATHTISFSTTPPNTYDFSWTPDPDSTLENVTITGGEDGIEGVEGGALVDVGSTITLQPADGFRWRTDGMFPTVSTSPTLPTGVSGGDTVSAVAESTAGGTVSISGMWTPTANYEGVVTFTAPADGMGSVEAVPALPAGSASITEWPGRFAIGSFDRIPNTYATGVNNAGTALSFQSSFSIDLENIPRTEAFGIGGRSANLTLTLTPSSTSQGDSVQTVDRTAFISYILTPESETVALVPFVWDGAAIDSSMSNQAIADYRNANITWSVDVTLRDDQGNIFQPGDVTGANPQTLTEANNA